MTCKERELELGGRLLTKASHMRPASIEPGPRKDRQTSCRVFPSIKRMLLELERPAGLERCWH